eukprot:7380146-Prymnesium_polylepis.1
MRLARRTLADRVLQGEVESSRVTRLQRPILPGLHSWVEGQPRRSFLRFEPLPYQPPCARVPVQRDGRADHEGQELAGRTHKCLAAAEGSTSPRVVDDRDGVGSEE